MRFCIRFLLRKLYLVHSLNAAQNQLARKKLKCRIIYNYEIIYSTYIVEGVKYEKSKGLGLGMP